MSLNIIDGIKNMKDTFVSSFTNLLPKTIGALPFSALIITYFKNFLLPLYILFILVIVDAITGVLIAVKKKELNSHEFSRTIWKYVTYTLSIFSVGLMEIVIGGIGGFLEQNAITTFLIGILIVTEAISILENCSKLGLPIPKNFLNLLSKGVMRKKWEL